MIDLHHYVSLSFYAFVTAGLEDKFLLYHFHSIVGLIPLVLDQKDLAVATQPDHLNEHEVILLRCVCWRYTT